MRSPLALVIFVAACGGRAARPMGVREHLATAEQADDAAARHDEIAEHVEGNVVPCDDAVGPCWAGERDVAEEHRAEAERLRADADAHRDRAQALIAAERESCAQLSPDELSHTPFAHRADIVAVTAVHEDDAVRGAEIRFRPVRGLTATWIQVAINCHRARAAVFGPEVPYMIYDPTTVVGAEVAVVDDPDGITVIVRAEDDEVAKIVYARAAHLLDTDATTARR